MTSFFEDLQQIFGYEGRKLLVLQARFMEVRVMRRLQERYYSLVRCVWKDYLCLRAEEAEALACLLELEACVGNVRGPLVIKGDYVNT